jgi:CubicO group peptidase (beta-lactamase class C family)
MTRRCLSGLCAAAIAAAIGIASSVHARQSAAADVRVDAIFARWTKATPGCAVGASLKGEPVLQRAYGMADLEHDVPNKTDTIFEAGSVSKQFTAAAVLLLARDGKLTLDDPVRKYVPELPDYGSPLTIRHMLNHTSGLRDWGSVAEIAGWPRTTRVHTHAHVLDILSRQRSLNFTPGTRWSYSNSGYNLAAIIVSRVSGQSFADFTRTRIFEPLGMKRTSWRDDYTRIVKDRAIAYNAGRDGFTTEMPFENVHGNGGLLTTIADLLRWSQNFSSPVVGDEKFVAEQQEPGRFTDGRRHDYALGLRVGTYRGLSEISHSGATAGYRAYLSRFPDEKLAVAVLCNVSSGDATQYAHAVADLYVGAKAAPVATATQINGAPAANGATTGTADLDGMYRRADTGEPTTFTRAGADLRSQNGATLTARSATRYAGANGQSYEFAPDGTLSIVDQFGTVQTYARVTTTELPARSLTDYAGEYGSDDAEVTMTAAVQGDALVLRRRPDAVMTLTPLYADAFRAPIGFVRFHRNAAGTVVAFSVTQDRVWDLRFTKK